MRMLRLIFKTSNRVVFVVTPRFDSKRPFFLVDLSIRLLVNPITRFVSCQSKCVMHLTIKLGQLDFEVNKTVHYQVTLSIIQMSVLTQITPSNVI